MTTTTPAATAAEVMERTRRLAAANTAIGLFSRMSLRYLPRKGLFVHLRQNGLQRWQTVSGNPFRPNWTVAVKTDPIRLAMLSQLCRWVIGRPVLGLDQWRYWLAVLQTPDKSAARVLHALDDAGYPARSICCRCGLELTSAPAWLLDVGPVCHEGEPCAKRQPTDREYIPIP